MEMWYGAVDIGGTKIKTGLIDSGQRILGEAIFETPKGKNGAEEAVKGIVRRLEELCGKAEGEFSRISGIGIVCAGPVDRMRGTVENPYTLPGWEGYPICLELERLTGKKVRMENDVAGALLGEVALRNLKGKRTLMICFGTGIGAAVYDYESLYRAGTRFYPELGHVGAGGDGPLCYCGQKGCFESLWSGTGLNRQAICAGYEGLRQMLGAWKAEPDKTRVQREEIFAQFQRGMWNLLLVFKPEILILGGGVMNSLYEDSKEAVMKLTQEKEDFLEAFEIYKAGSYGDPALIGASILIKEEKA